MNTTAATIKSGDRIINKNQVREVLSARTFGGRTDITFAGITNRYSTSQVQLAADTMVEVV